MNEQANTEISKQLEFVNNILATIREPLIILDKNLKVIAANRSFYNIFMVSEKETLGKLLYDLGNKQWDIPKLRKLLEEILPKNNYFDDYLVEHEFENIGKKFMELNARKIYNKTEKSSFILLAIEDVTKQLENEKKLNELHECKSQVKIPACR